MRNCRMLLTGQTEPEPWEEDSDEDSDASDEHDEDYEILRLTV